MSRPNRGRPDLDADDVRRRRIHRPRARTRERVAQRAAARMLDEEVVSGNAEPVGAGGDDRCTLKGRSRTAVLESRLRLARRQNVMDHVRRARAIDTQVLAGRPRLPSSRPSLKTDSSMRAMTAPPSAAGTSRTRRSPNSRTTMSVIIRPWGVSHAAQHPDPGAERGDIVRQQAV